MKIRLRSRAWCAAAAGAWLAAAGPVRAQQATPSPPVNPILAALEKMKRFTEPGASHKLLERFLGKWATETRFYLFGIATEPEKGVAEGSWLMKGRWLKLTWSGPYLGQQAEGFTLIGYDNFRQNYVTTSVTSIDTAMPRTAGDPNQARDALLLYGTVDDYETEEPDRMMKQVWRFASPDKLVLELYDMSLGDTGSKIVDVVFVRQPGPPPAK